MQTDMTKPRSPYARMFALPGAKAFCASAAIARLPLSMMSLGIVLALNRMYNNWTIAGAMSACYILAVAAVTPLYARMFDRLGQRKVGVPLLSVQVVVMFAFAFAALFRVPVGVLFALAIIMGATQFSFGALVRTRWAYLLERTDNNELLDTAYAFEAAVDEMVFILGPILAATLATSVHPVSQLFVPAAAAAIGGAVFFSLKDSMPPVLKPVATEVSKTNAEAKTVPGAASAHGSWVSTGDAADEAHGLGRGVLVKSHNKSTRNVLLLAGILPLMLTFLIFNMSFSAFDVSITAAMEAAGLEKFLGIQLAMLALGSLIGAMVFGSREHRGSHWRRMVVCLVILAAGFMAMHAVMDHFIALGIVEVLSGLVIAPLLATGNLIVKDTVPEHSLTEGLSWLTTFNSVGTSLGSMIGGVVLDHIDTHAGLMMTWVVVVASIPFALIGWFVVSRKDRREFTTTASDERRW